MCHALKYFETSLQTYIYQHPSETKQRFKTAHLACAQLSNCEIISDSKEIDILLESAPPTALFYPLAEAKVWDYESAKAYKNVIILDGTWSKARRLIHENPKLRELSCFQLPLTGSGTKLRPLRKAPEEHHLSTLEAIAHIHQIAENQIEYQKITEVLDEWVRLQKEFTQLGEK